MNKLIALAIAGFVAMAATAPVTPATAESRYGKQKVVYHINYMGGPKSKKYLGAMRNVQNHINAVGADKLDIRVVLHGNGVYILRDAVKNLRLQGAISNLKNQKVGFYICANTLRGRKINFETDLFEAHAEDIVPSGVAELAHLQGKGYTYIKP